MSIAIRRRRPAALVLAATCSALAASSCVPSFTMSPAAPAERTCPVTHAAGGDGAVRWFFPEHPDDNATLEEWCKTVGPPVILAAPSRPAAAPVAGDTLLLASFNTNGGAGDLIAFIEMELGLECDASTTAHPPPFVILVQEALRRSNDIPEPVSFDAIPRVLVENERETERLDIAGVARRCGLSLAYVPSMRNGPDPRDGLREDRGNAILSTLPLSDPLAIEQPFEGSRRVGVLARITAPGSRSILVASVHLHTVSLPWRLLVTGNGARWREAAALIDVFDRLDLEQGPAGVSTVVAGDMNTWTTRHTAISLLREHFPDSPDQLPEPTRGAFPTDHLMFRAARMTGRTPDAIVAGSYRRVNEVHFSDHHPVVAVLRFGQ